MPDDLGVYAVYEGPLDDSPVTTTVTARLHPKTVSAMIWVASLLVHRCQACPPGRSRKLIRRFNAAAYQVFRNNFPPIQRLARTLDSEGEKGMP